MTEHVQLEFLMLADHPMLDLLNTVPMTESGLVDLLQRDADATRWMVAAGFPVSAYDLRPSALVTALRDLREILRPIVERRKAGKRTDVAALNEFLAQARSHVMLTPEKDGRFRLQRHWKTRTPEQRLAPLAEAAAEFLATTDFDLVRRCESDACVLWFYDRTKSHHRRWCSMGTCGNRAKVAAFRERRARA